MGSKLSLRKREAVVLLYFRHCEERKRRSNPAYFVAPKLDCFASARNDGEKPSRASMRQNLRQKLLRAVAAGAAEEIVLALILDDFALVHEDHPVRYLAGKTHFMGDHHHGHALAGEIDHHVEHFRDHLGI